MKKKSHRALNLPNPPPVFKGSNTALLHSTTNGGGGRRVDPRYNCLHLCPTTSEASDAHIVTIPVDEVDPHSQG